MVVGANELNEVENDWTLVWSDEFEGDQLDETKWTRDLGNGFFQEDGTFIPGWGNQELQSYQEDNVRVENGYLILEGRKETVSDHTGTYHYTSGKVHTQGKFSQKYGRFEASIKLPEGQGYWPAFWMMPENDVYGGWAASGEIDIMENAGGTPHKIGGAIHYGGQWPNNTYTAKDYYFPDGKDVTDFNLYAVEWEPGEIRWYVNDVLYQTLNNWSSTSFGNPAKFSYPAPFDQEFYLILNLAIGGWYGGNPDDSTPFPGEMVVDYVRVYELTGRDYLVPVEPVFEPVELPADAKVAVDGNYVYDTNYEKEFTVLRTNEDVANNWNDTYWNFLNLDEFNGMGSVSVDTLNGDKYAKVDISNGGNQTYSIQLIQNVTMGKGRWYKLSFDAKSNTNRGMNVKIGGGADRGWTAYSPNMDYQLSNEIQTFEMIFQMQHDTDSRARLEFNLGLNTNPVWIGNVIVEEVDALDPYNEEAPKRPLRDGNHVYNGTFDQGRMDRMTYWNFEVNGAEALASVDPDARELAVFIIEGGSSVDSIKLVQNGMNLLPTDEYMVTFDAKATEDRDIVVALLSKDGSINYSSNQVISLTAHMDTKVFSFVMPNVEDIEGQLSFFLGGNNHDVVIDNVRMIRTTNNNGSVSVEQAFPLKNGDFSNGMVHWDQHIHGNYEPSSEATFEIIDGSFKANIMSTGWEPWHLILMQNGMRFLANQTYVLEFEAKSTVDREVRVVIENSTYNAYFARDIELTDAMETYSYEFLMSADDTVDLKFLLGKVGNSDEVGNHDIVIDNVKLEVKGERERYFPLKNGDFSAGIANWNNYVHYDAQASFSEEDGKAKMTFAHTGNETWSVQFFQDNLMLEEGQKYIIQFDARTSLDRSIEVTVENASYHRYFSEEIALTTQTGTYKYEFEMNSTDVTALKFLLGSVGDVIAVSHDIFIDNVRLEVKGAREVLYGSQADEEPTEPGNGEEPGDGAEPVTPAPTPQPETPGKVVVNNPQVNKGKIRVVIGKEDKVVMLPSQAAVINRDNKVVIEREDFLMEVPGTVLESLKELGKGDPNSKISISFEKLKKEVIENNLVEQGSLKKAGIRLAGDIFEFNLSVLAGGNEKKLSSFEEPIRVKLKIFDDANIDLVGIYKVEEDGRLIYVGGDADGQTISTNLNSFSKYAVLEYDKSFEDVPQDFWAHDTIKKLSSRHIINGYTNGDFAPRKAVTRAEFASMLVRALNLKSDKKVLFNDVADTAWYAKDIAAAYEAGIIKGIDIQKFAPNERITREQMTVMVVRAYEFVNGPIGDVEITTEFVDEHTVSTWAKNSVKQATHLKLVNGRGNGTLNPLASANRAESAQIIFNLLFH